MNGKKAKAMRKFCRTHHRPYQAYKRAYTLLSWLNKTMVSDTMEKAC